MSTTSRGTAHGPDLRALLIILLELLIVIHCAKAIDYAAYRRDAIPRGVTRENARTTRDILEELNLRRASSSHDLQDGTEHLLQYGALLRTQILDTFGKLVYDHYDDFGMSQIEALYRIYRETLERKYNIFDIVPKILDDPDTRPTKICAHINERVRTCLKESSEACMNIEIHDEPHPATVSEPALNVTRQIYRLAEIPRYYPNGFSLDAVLDHLRARRIRFTPALFSGLLHNVQYDSFDDRVRTAERELVSFLNRSPRYFDSKMIEQSSADAASVSQLLKSYLTDNEKIFRGKASEHAACLAQHVVREVDAVSENIELLGTVYDNATINLGYLFKLILPDDTIDRDVLEARDYLLREVVTRNIVESHLRVEKYQQAGPDQLLMEILGQLRDIKFAEDIVTSLHCQARFWHRSHMIENLNELLELFDAYENLRRLPNFAGLMEVADTIKNNLRDSRNVTVQLLCSRPRACLRIGLEIVFNCSTINEETKGAIVEFVERTSCGWSCLIEDWQVINESTTERRNQDEVMITTKVPPAIGSEEVEIPAIGILTSDIGNKSITISSSTTESISSNSTWYDDYYDIDSGYSYSSEYDEKSSDKTVNGSSETAKVPGKNLPVGINENESTDNRCKGDCRSGKCNGTDCTPQVAECSGINCSTVGCTGDDCPARGNCTGVGCTEGKECEGPLCRDREIGRGNCDGPDCELNKTRGNCKGPDCLVDSKEIRSDCEGVDCVRNSTDSDCVGPDCSDSNCVGRDCEVSSGRSSSCEGDDCESSSCEGDDCESSSCEGDDCESSSCEGDDCESSSCEGDDCESSGCEGDDCESSSCEGDDCEDKSTVGNSCVGPDCTDENDQCQGPDCSATGCVGNSCKANTSLIVCKGHDCPESPIIEHCEGADCLGTGGFCKGPDCLGDGEIKCSGNDCIAESAETHCAGGNCSGPASSGKIKCEGSDCLGNLTACTGDNCPGCSANSTKLGACKGTDSESEQSDEDCESEDCFDTTSEGEICEGDDGSDRSSININCNDSDCDVNVTEIKCEGSDCSVKKRKIKADCKRASCPKSKVKGNCEGTNCPITGEETTIDYMGADCPITEEEKDNCEGPHCPPITDYSDISCNGTDCSISVEDTSEECRGDDCSESESSENRSHLSEGIRNETKLACEGADCPISEGENYCDGPDCPVVEKGVKIDCKGANCSTLKVKGNCEGSDCPIIGEAILGNGTKGDCVGANCPITEEEVDNCEGPHCPPITDYSDISCNGTDCSISVEDTSEECRGDDCSESESSENRSHLSEGIRNETKLACEGADCPISEGENYCDGPDCPVVEKGVKIDCKGANCSTLKVKGNCEGSDCPINGEAILVNGTKGDCVGANCPITEEEVDNCEGPHCPPITDYPDISCNGTDCSISVEDTSEDCKGDDCSESESSQNRSHLPEGIRNETKLACEGADCPISEEENYCDGPDCPVVEKGVKIDCKGANCSTLKVKGNCEGSDCPIIGEAILGNGTTGDCVGANCPITEEEVDNCEGPHCPPITDYPDISCNGTDCSISVEDTSEDCKGDDCSESESSQNRSHLPEGIRNETKLACEGADCPISEEENYCDGPDCPVVEKEVKIDCKGANCSTLKVKGNCEGSDCPIIGEAILGNGTKGDCVGANCPITEEEVDNCEGRHCPPITDYSDISCNGTDCSISVEDTSEECRGDDCSESESSENRSHLSEGIRNETKLPCEGADCPISEGENYCDGPDCPVVEKGVKIDCKGANCSTLKVKGNCEGTDCPIIGEAILGNGTKGDCVGANCPITEEEVDNCEGPHCPPITDYSDISCNGTDCSISVEDTSEDCEGDDCSVSDSVESPCIGPECSENTQVSCPSGNCSTHIPPPISQMNRTESYTHTHHQNQMITFCDHSDPHYKRKLKRLQKMRRIDADSSTPRTWSAIFASPRPISDASETSTKIYSDKINQAKNPLLQMLGVEASNFPRHNNSIISRSKNPHNQEDISEVLPSPNRGSSERLNILTELSIKKIAEKSSEEAPTPRPERIHEILKELRKSSGEKVEMKITEFDEDDVASNDDDSSSAETIFSWERIKPWKTQEDQRGGHHWRDKVIGFRDHDFRNDRKALMRRKVVGSDNRKVSRRGMKLRKVHGEVRAGKVAAARRAKSRRSYPSGTSRRFIVRAQPRLRPTKIHRPNMVDD